MDLRLPVVFPASLSYKSIKAEPLQRKGQPIVTPLEMSFGLRHNSIYVFVNYALKTRLRLPNDNYEQPLISMSSPKDHPAIDSEKWKAISGPGGQYQFLNAKFSTYITSRIPLEEDGEVVGRVSGAIDSIWWFVENLSSHGPDAYVIRPSSQPNLCWSLISGEDETPLCLQEFTPNPENIWQVVQIDIPGQAIQEHFNAGNTLRRSYSNQEDAKEDIDPDGFALVAHYIHSATVDSTKKVEMISQVMTDLEPHSSNSSNYTHTQSRESFDQSHAPEHTAGYITVLALINAFVRSSDFDADEKVKNIDTILSLKDAGVLLPPLPEAENISQYLVTTLDYVLSKCTLSQPLYRRCFRHLRSVSARTGHLPATFLLATPKLSKTKYIAYGGFSDVWLGTYDGDQSVAFKVLRFTNESNRQKTIKNFCREAVVWKHLNHPNIVRFLGVNMDVFPLCLISEWMIHQDVSTYIHKQNPSVDRRMIIMDIADGLHYLHDFRLVHGDLKCANVLVDEKGRAKLADFGLSSIIYEAGSYQKFSLTATPQGTLRWMAPELHDPEDAGIGEDDALLTAASDVYAFSMVMLELYTGRVPYSECRTDGAVIARVINQDKPKRPDGTENLGLTDNIWALMEMCWSYRRGDRPTMTIVRQNLAEYFHPFAHPSSRHA